MLPGLDIVTSRRYMCPYRKVCASCMDYRYITKQHCWALNRRSTAHNNGLLERKQQQNPCWKRTCAQSKSIGLSSNCTPFVVSSCTVAGVSEVFACSTGLCTYPSDDVLSLFPIKLWRCRLPVPLRENAPRLAAERVRLSRFAGKPSREEERSVEAGDAVVAAVEVVFAAESVLLVYEWLDSVMRRGTELRLVVSSGEGSAGGGW